MTRVNNIAPSPMNTPARPPSNTVLRVFSLDLLTPAVSTFSAIFAGGWASTVTPLPTLSTAAAIRATSPAFSGTSVSSRGVTILVSFSSCLIALLLSPLLLGQSAPQPGGMPLVQLAQPALYLLDIAAG